MFLYNLYLVLFESVLDYFLRLLLWYLAHLHRTL